MAELADGDDDDGALHLIAMRVVIEVEFLVPTFRRADDVADWHCWNFEGPV